MNGLEESQMSHPAIQLYSLRQCTESLPDIIRLVADAGFEGVEFANRITTASVTDVQDAIDETGIQPIAAHIELDRIEREMDAVVDRFDRVGCNHFIIPHIGCERFRTVSQAETLAKTLLEVADALEQRGCRLGVHTTRELFLPMFGTNPVGLLLHVNGLPRGGYNHIGWATGLSRRRNAATLTRRTPIGRIAAITAGSTIDFEIDTKSVLSARFPLETILTEFGDRTSLIHLSDIVQTRRVPPDFQSVDPGTGLVDVDATVAVIDAFDIDWCIFEHADPVDPYETLDQPRILTSSVTPPLSSLHIDSTVPSSP